MPTAQAISPSQQKRTTFRCYMCLPIMFFPGTNLKTKSWTEDDDCEPRSVYGHSKRVGEEQVLDGCSRALVLRTSWVFGRYGNNFPKTMLRLARERDELRVVGDQFGCPTHAGDIAATLVKAAQAMVAGKLAAGIYHYAGAPACTWHAFAEQIIETAFAKGMLGEKTARDCYCHA